MTKKVTVVVDAYGGDNAPDAVLAGVEEALNKDANINIILTGLKETVESFAAKHDRVQACPCTEVITMEEHPADAVRTKKDSSIVVGCNLVREGKAGGFFSAGSTGACMAAALLRMGRIKGVSRPAIVTVIPTPAGEMVFCDIGANAICKPEYLVQFAKMGQVYSEVILGKENPTVALLNIGEEETKGSQFAQDTYALLKENVKNFAGNAEGKNLAIGGFDVIVTDGFTGNVALKTIEGTTKVLMSEIKEALMSSLKTKIGALLIKDALYSMKSKLSADTYGGAQLLGVKGVCLIGHGNSKPSAICSGILATATAIREETPKKLAEAISSEDIENALN